MSPPRDTNGMPDSAIENGKQTRVRRLWDRFGQGRKTRRDEEAAVASGSNGVLTETDPLLPPRGNGSTGVDAGNGAGLRSGGEQGASAFGGDGRTTWRKELVSVALYALPTVFTMVLQQVLLITTLVSAGRLGTLEMGAVNLSEMIAILTMVGPASGLSGSLDTLCAQAFGSGNKHLVGLHVQRMMAFLCLWAIPVVILWLNITPILSRLVSEPRTVELTAQFLRGLTLAIPGVCLSECAKRYVSSQGLFRAIALAITGSASLSIFFNWFLVFKLGWGFTGLSIALAVSELTFPLNVFLFVIFVDGRKCWGGFSRRAFVNWGSMLKLAIPSMIMVLADWIAWEGLALLSVQFGSDYLAANGVLIAMVGLAFQIPLGIGIAASTRVAHWIGAGRIDSAKTAAKMSLCINVAAMAIDFCILAFLSRKIAALITDDSRVLALVAATAPIGACSHIMDSLAALSHSLLRALGRQKIGGLTAVTLYWVIGIPLGVLMAFKLDMKLDGLWLGLVIALVFVCGIEYTFVIKMDWNNAVRDANERNAAN